MPNSPDNFVYLNLLYHTMDRAPLLANWRPLLDVTQADVGFVGKAYYNDITGEIVMTIRGPSSLSGAGLPGTVMVGAGETDTTIASGQEPVGYQQAAEAFRDSVITSAGNLALSTDPENIFVTGNSLGGYGAQYLAALFGYGGANYGGPGVYGLAIPETRPENFISYVNQGDAVANAASDTGIFSADFGFGAHYGQLNFIGNPAAQQLLAQIASSIEPETLQGETGQLAAGEVLAALGAAAILTKSTHDIDIYGDILGAPVDPPPFPPEPSIVGSIVETFQTIQSYVDGIRDAYNGVANAIEDFFNGGEIPWPAFGWDSFGNTILQLGGASVLIVPAGAQATVSASAPGVLTVTSSVGGVPTTSTLNFLPDAETFLTARSVDAFDHLAKEVVVANDTSRTETVFDTGTAPWSQHIEQFDAFNRLMQTTIVDHNGESATIDVDEDNSQSWSQQIKLGDGAGKDVVETADSGAITVTIDNSVVANASQILGSKLGQVLGGNTVLGQFAAGTLASAIGREIGFAIHQGSFFDLVSNSISDPVNAAFQGFSSTFTASDQHDMENE